MFRLFMFDLAASLIHIAHRIQYTIGVKCMHEEKTAGTTNAYALLPSICLLQI